MSGHAGHARHGQGFLRKLDLGAGALRLGMNLWPPFVGAGIHVLGIAPDFRSVKVELRMRWYNRNYVGTHFGGSLYAMTDPFFAVMLIKNLGRGYTVWDKASTIEYLRPGRGTVTASFILKQEQIAEALEMTAAGNKFEPTYRVEVVDHAGQVVATVDKTLYIRRLPGAAELG